MHDFVIGILGNDYIKTTDTVNKIIANTKATKDQDHVKMNIVINNKLLDKKDSEILEILSNLEKCKTDYLFLCIDDKKICKIIKNNTKIPIINKFRLGRLIK